MMEFNTRGQLERFAAQSPHEVEVRDGRVYELVEYDNGSVEPQVVGAVTDALTFITSPPFILGLAVGVGVGVVLD